MHSVSPGGTTACSKTGMSTSTRRGRAEAMEQFIARHGMQLLRAARRYSESAADAEDVYQSTIEVILLKAPESYDDDRLLAWALTVTRNEALMERRRNRRVVAGAFEEIAERLMDHSVDVDEQVVEGERIGHGREALERVSTNQMRCLLLRADGLNYTEISEITGFSYAKVNRCLSEGRKAFHVHVERLESGSECRRLASVLSMMADDRASDEAVADAELHLHGCVGCRATLRDYRDVPDRAALGLPLGIAVTVGDAGARSNGVFQRIGDAWQSAYANLQERLFGHSATVHQGGEIALAKKAAIAVACTATLVAGGSAVQRATDSGSATDRSRSAQASPTAADLSASPSSSSGEQQAAEKARARARARRRARRARAASEADVRRAVPGVESTASAAAKAGEGRSAGDGDEFNPQPAVVEPSLDGSSDTETGLAP